MTAIVDNDVQGIESIYSYWFGENINTWSKNYPLNTKLWFKMNEHVDQEIKHKFENYLIDAAKPNSHLYQRWQTTDRGKLVLIILLDQFPRNIYRGTAKMFAYDHLALKLSLDIINNPTHMTLYSLPERLFIYLPLIHSEDLLHTSKGAELMHDLAAEVTQRDVRRRYAANARAAKTHEEVIRLFGRYPHRNQLLGRESTIDEENYLKTAHNGFVKSVQFAPPPETPSPPQSEHPPLKILVLHGFHQNSNSLKRSAKKLFKSLKDIATFHFANAPLPYNPTGEVKEQLLAAFGEGNVPETNYQRQWWNASKDNKIYHYLDVSLHYIDKLFKSEGPFDGIFGFAQGASLGGILSGLQPYGNISFKFAILISGFASRADAHQQLMQPNAVKNVASLHIYGVNDVLITNDRTLKLAEAFENKTVVSHAGGHFTPNTWPNQVIRQFLIQQLERIATVEIDFTQIQSLKTFEEKLEAVISYYQKQKKMPLIPIDLSESADDMMLRIWCERTTFYNAEPKDTSSSFFQDWISIYVKEPDEILSQHINLIPKYGSWGDIKTLYLTAHEMMDEKFLLDKLKSTCVKMFGDQLQYDQRIIENQLDASVDEQTDEGNYYKHRKVHMQSYIRIHLRRPKLTISKTDHSL